MNPACQICRGACCESLVFELPDSDLGRWLGVHGKPIGPAQVELPAPCTKLGTCGSCTIHETRPDHCRTYEVGGIDCRATVLRRRPEQAPEILAAMPHPSAFLPLDL